MHRINQLINQTIRPTNLLNNQICYSPSPIKQPSQSSLSHNQSTNNARTNPSINQTSHSTNQSSQLNGQPNNQAINKYNNHAIKPHNQIFIVANQSTKQREFRSQTNQPRNQPINQIKSINQFMPSLGSTNQVDQSTIPTS